MPRKPTLLIDFDGVLHTYHGWVKDVPLGRPIDKARAALWQLEPKYRLLCFTSRTNTEEIRAWLRRHGFPEMRITNIKEPAHLIIDDRTICFQGVWTDDLLTRITSFTPHWSPSGASPDASGETPVDLDTVKDTSL